MNPDLIQYDSQELVADYDDRSEVMRALQQQTMISPSQDLSFNSIHTSHLPTTLNHDSAHLAPISVLNVIIPSDFDCNQYDSQELVADYDDRSEVMRDLQLKTMISPSQDFSFNSINTSHLHLDVQPTFNYDYSHLAPISVPDVTIPFDETGLDPIYMSGSIKYSLNSTIEEDLDGAADNTAMDTLTTIPWDDKKKKYNLKKKQKQQDRKKEKKRLERIAYNN
jgi:hypothetical protein